jgi:hydrogenase-4 component B
VTTGSLLALAAAAVAVSMVLTRRPLAGGWLALVLVGTGASAVAALRVLAGGAAWEWEPRVRVAGELLHFRLDALSALFVVVVCVTGAAGAVYARTYWHDDHHSSAPRGRLWWSALLLCMGLVLVVSNSVHFLIAWEAFAVSGYFLIVLDRTRKDVRAAGWLYLAASHAGTLCLFAFFALLAAHTGGWDLGPVRERPELAGLFWLALAGFGVKAGFFPLHVWLPPAHASAPSHVSAIMSGAAIKMGLYGIIRFGGWLPLPAGAGTVVIGLGAASAFAGIMFAFAQVDVKRLLAYSTVENSGIILVGVGGALLARARGDAAWGALALAGALLHTWNHAAFKSLLFLGAGSVVHGTGTRVMSRLGGLWRTMPVTSVAFGVGALAACGLPPLNGFVGEWVIYSGLFTGAADRGVTAWASGLAAIVVAAAGAVTLATFTKAAGVMFLGVPRTPSAMKAVEGGWWMRGPIVVLASACAGLVVLPAVAWPWFVRAAGSRGPSGMPLAMPDGLAMVVAGSVMLGALGAAAVALLWRQVRVNGQRRGPTWDCGYAAPTARMQYSSASFAWIAAGWFRWALSPAISERRPRGLLPAGATRVERFPEAVLDRLVVPAADRVQRWSEWARRLQHGGMQSYILYLLFAVTAMGVLVLAGGRR